MLDKLGLDIRALLGRRWPDEIEIVIEEALGEKPRKLSYQQLRRLTPAQRVTYARSREPKRPGSRQSNNTLSARIGR